MSVKKAILLTLSAVLFCGCSSGSPSDTSSASGSDVSSQTSSSSLASSDSTPHNAPGSLDQATVNNTLTNAGWTPQTVEPALYQLWGVGNKPTAVSMGVKNGEGGDSAEFAGAWFADEKTAKAAYEAVAVQGNQTTEKAEEGKYGDEQVWISVPDAGWWLIRRQGTNVLCAWVNQPERRQELADLFDAFNG